MKTIFEKTTKITNFRSGVSRETVVSNCIRVDGSQFVRVDVKGFTTITLNLTEDGRLICSDVRNRFHEYKTWSSAVRNFKSHVSNLARCDYDAIDVAAVIVLVDEALKATECDALCVPRETKPEAEKDYSLARVETYAKPFTPLAIKACYTSSLNVYKILRDGRTLEFYVGYNQFEGFRHFSSYLSALKWSKYQPLKIKP